MYLIFCWEELKLSLIELFLIAVGLSMDAFAVSVCKGLAASEVRCRHFIAAGLWFGGFQALMPFIGYMLGSSFEKYITAFDHWVAFGLLIIIGGNMIKEALSDEEENASGSFSAGSMFPMAVATSIDALAVGITFALLPQVNIGAAVLFIGAVTFVLAGAGVKIGSVFGLRYRSKAELAGGIILILIGLKILLEHLGIINF